MLDIPDDPVIACMERTGYPPWFFYNIYDREENETDVQEDDDKQV